MISIIACIGKNGELGKKGDLCFHFKEDMDFFKKTTEGHTCVMGRKTWESLPQPLSNRRSVVVSHTEPPLKNGKKPFGVIFDDFPEVLKALAHDEEEFFIIGGGQIYEQALPYATNIYLTEVDLADPEADTFFPEFDRNDFETTILEIYPQFKIIKYERGYYEPC